MRILSVLAAAAAVAVAVAVAVAPAPAAAQDWRQSVTNNGQWFEGWLVSPGEVLSVWCGGPTPGGPGLPQTDEPMLTEPGTFDLALRLPAPDPSEPAFVTGLRNDLMIVAAGQGFGLPDSHWDELNGMGWIQRLGTGDPLFSALAQGGEVQVWAAGTFVTSLQGSGLAEGLVAIGSFCAAGGGAEQPAGQPGALPAGMPAPAAAVGPSLDIVHAAIARGCEGPAVADPGYVLSGDIDGDGVPDIVLDWAAVTCQTAIPRPFCGAANCSAEVFLSSRPDQVPFDTILAAGLALEPAAEGAVRLISGVTAASCPRTTRPDRCEVVWTWTGTALQPLPPGGG